MKIKIEPNLKLVGDFRGKFTPEKRFEIRKLFHTGGIVEISEELIQYFPEGFWSVVSDEEKKVEDVVEETSDIEKNILKAPSKTSSQKYNKKKSSLN